VHPGENNGGERICRKRIGRRNQSLFAYIKQRKPNHICPSLLVFGFHRRYCKDVQYEQQEHFPPPIEGKTKIKKIFGERGCFGMNRADISQAIGQIDLIYIQEAMAVKRSTQRLHKVCKLAACICVGVLAASLITVTAFAKSETFRDAVISILYIQAMRS
jgi:hypothetical protein